VGAGEGATLVCRHCAVTRPSLCLACGSSRLKLLRPGVRRVREELERLAGVPVGEVTGDADVAANLSDVPILVGTEAVLHRSLHPDVVAFLDLDAELLAPRYRAAEQALALVARAARLLGGRADGGRLVLQTRLPGHEVVQAALHADPGRVAAAEGERRRALRFPPTTAVALVSGPPASTYVSGLGERTDVEVLGPADGRWLVRAPDHRMLCDALAAVPRPPGRLRIAVDPLRM
jgi:primosomal protein N' (replication factor Y)